MNDNPYAASNVAAIAAAADERASFLQRTYSLLLAGVAVFAATIWAVANVPAVGNVAVSIYRTNPWIFLLLWFGLGFGVRAVAEVKPINLIGYFAYAAFFGLVFAPLVLVTLNAQPTVLTQAAIVTLLVFSGLTAYVFISGKDFSFLRGAIWIVSLLMLGVIIMGIFTGFEAGLWFSGLGVLLFSGFILYDTSRILHHYPVTAHVRAAIELFASLVLLFQYVLHIMSALNRD